MTRRFFAGRDAGRPVLGGQRRLPWITLALLATLSAVGAAWGLTASGDGLLAQAQQPAARMSGASPDVFTFVRALDEAASRNVWPGFEPSRVPLALFDGERTVLLRHPSPPPEFTPWPDHPGALVVNGRHPAVAGNSTREIGGVRTATVIATLPQSVESTTLAVVEEVFHVFWLARHPVFRPDEMARYGYPLDAADNQRAILAEDEALARAIEAAPAADAARWAAAALDIRRGRVPALPGDVRAFEAALEMMEGTANYVARVAAGERPAQTAARLRRRRPADGIRWRFYDSGAALCFVLDRLSPGWKAEAERQPALTTVDQLESAVRAGAVRPASFTAAESAGFATAASADIADLANRREQLRAALLSRAGARIVIDLAPGAEPLRVRRFDPVNLMVLAAGQVAHPHYLTLESPEGAVDLDNPGYVRGAFDGTVGLTAPAGRHPFSAGIRQLTIVGMTAAPVIADESGAIRVDAPGLRIRLRGSLTREAGGSFRITLGEGP